ncbi:MAG TPA: WYL domain-containing protein [Saprospiraceae bacterium]|nr:WYL domain-containing protein [Saprospiraceae bacterium]
MDDTRPVRTLRLLMMLSGSRRYTMAELMDKFAMSECNLRRDLLLLESAGFVLDRKNGYRIVLEGNRSGVLKKILHFSEEEIALIYGALTTLDAASSIKARLLKKMNAFYDLKVIEKLKEKDDLQKVSLLRRSMEQGKQVILSNYRSSNSQTIEDRQVEAFDFGPDYETVWCYDLRDHECKQFKVTRMSGVCLTATDWKYKGSHRRPFTDIFRVSAPEAIDRVKLRLSLRAYNLVVEEYPLANNYIRQAESSYLLEAPIAEYSGVGRFVMGFLDEVQVLESEGLKEYINRLIRSYDVGNVWK